MYLASGVTSAVWRRAGGQINTFGGEENEFLVGLKCHQSATGQVVAAAALKYCVCVCVYI